MENSTKNKLVFLASLLFATGVYAWFYPLNKGDLNITTGLENYLASIGSQTIQCPKDPCSIRLKSGAYSVRIQKEKYSLQDFQVTVKRGKTNELSVTLKKIPNLTVSPIIPEDKKETVEKEIPEELKSVSLLAPTWHTNNQLAFIDLNDDRLKIRNEKGETQVITTLKNLNSEFVLYWSPEANRLAGKSINDIYFIDIEKASRKKFTLDVLVKNIVWSPSGEFVLFNNSQNDLYKINFKGSVTPMKIELNLKNSVWIDRENLVLFVNGKDVNQVTIEKFNLTSFEKSEILRKFNFPINDISIDDKGVIYFYNRNLESWYYLDQ